MRTVWLPGMVRPSETVTSLRTLTGLAAAMNEDVIGHRVFADGLSRPVFLDLAGKQNVLDGEGRRVHGIWVLPGRSTFRTPPRPARFVSAPNPAPLLAHGLPPPPPHAARFGNNPSRPSWQRGRPFCPANE